MNINRISASSFLNRTMPSFKGKFIDSHMHIGCEDGYRPEDLNKFFIRNFDGDTLELAFVSNLDCMGGNSALLDEIDGNRDTLEASKKSGGKIIPLAVCQPRNGNASNLKELFDENPNEFKGIKFHPEMESLPVTDRKYKPYLKLAQQYKMPCLFHCEIPWKEYKTGWDLIKKRFRNSEPQQVYKAAKNIPDTPVIMAHLGSGGERVHTEAQKVLMDSIKKGDALLYADISWVDCNNPQKPVLIQTIKMLQNTPKGDMTNRLLFGSDAPIGDFGTGRENYINGKKVKLSAEEYYEKEMHDIKQAIRDNFDEETAEVLIENIFYNNAKKLYLTKDWH